jgi:hypothetical protein
LFSRLHMQVLVLANDGRALSALFTST